MSEGAAGAMLAGSLVSAYGIQEEATAQSQIAAEKAMLKKKEEDEIIARAQINSEALRLQGIDLEKAQVSGFARGNVALTGSPLMFLEEQQAKVRQEIILLNREASFRASQLNSEGNIIAKEAEAYRQAANIRTFGTLLGGGASAANTLSSNKSKGA